MDYSADFLEFDTYVNVTLPPYNEYWFHIAGFKEDQEFDSWGGYWLHDVHYLLDKDVVTDPLKLGYLDRFPKYRTQFHIGLDGYKYSMVQFGEALDALVIPEKPIFNIIDVSINAFQFTIDIEFLKVRHKWTHVEGSHATNNYSHTLWSVTAAKGYDPIVKNLPEEIV